MSTLPKEHLPPNPKILLIKLRSIGDVIYNTAVYSPIKKTWPKGRLTVVVEPPAYDIVRHHPDVDKVLILEKGTLIKQMFFYWRLFQERYDIAIDMHEGPRGALMGFVSLARFRVGNALAKRSFFYNLKLDFSEYKPKLPIDYQIGLIRKMGVNVEEPLPAVYISQHSRDRAQRILSEKGISWGDHFCILHPGARTYDQWQYEKFAELVDRLHNQYQFKIVLTCGPGQKNQAQGVWEKIRSAPYSFIETGLQELGAITERARFVICHNGGYMHLTAAVGTPVIALFGLSNPDIWQPLGQNHIVLHHKLDCFPCSSKTIREICTSGRPECKERISVEEVLQAVETILNTPTSLHK